MSRIKTAVAGTVLALPLVLVGTQLVATANSSDTAPSSSTADRERPGGDVGFRPDRHSSSARATAAKAGVEHFDETTDYVDNLCGRDWDVHARDWGQFRLLATPKGAPIELESTHYNYARTLVAQDNGDTYRRTGRGLFHVESARRTQGNVWRTVIVEGGNPGNILSASGYPIRQEFGLLKVVVFIDTQGDNDPENDEFVSQTIKDWGTFYWSTTEPGSEYCQYVVAAINRG